MNPNPAHQNASSAGLLAELVDADRHPWLDACERLLRALWLLLALGVFLTAASGRPPRPQPVAPTGLIEAESLTVVAKSREFEWWLQPTTSFPGGSWSQDGHMFALETRRGDWIDLALPPAPAGEYRVSLYFTRARDYAIVSVSLNGQPLGEPIDLWAGSGAEPMKPVELPPRALGGDGDVLRIRVEDTNPAASPPFYQFGLDGVRLSRSGARR